MMGNTIVWGLSVTNEEEGVTTLVLCIDLESDDKVNSVDILLEPGEDLEFFESLVEELRKIVEGE